MSFLAGLKAFFSFDGVANSAIKIVDRIAGTDWTPKEQADWILKYQEATKPYKALHSRFFYVRNGVIRFCLFVYRLPSLPLCILYIKWRYDSSTSIKPELS